MLDHAREAVERARGKTRADLDSNRQLNLALVRLLEIIGEAAWHRPLRSVLPSPLIRASSRQATRGIMHVKLVPTGRGCTAHGFSLCGCSSRLTYSEEKANIRPTREHLTRRAVDFGEQGG